MPYIPAVGVIQAELIYNWDGQVCENVFHYLVEPEPTIANMTILGAGLAGHWNTGMKAIMPATLQLQNIRLTDLTTQTGPVVNYGVGLPNVGTNGTNSLPNNCAVVYTKRTDKRGRAYRGRTYIPGLTEAGVTGNAVLSSNLTVYAAWLASIRQPTYSSISFAMVVVSKYLDNVARVVADKTLVTGFTTDGVVDSQRRRLPGRGA